MITYPSSRLATPCLLALALVAGCGPAGGARDSAGVDARTAPQNAPMSGSPSAGDTATLATPQGPAFVSGDSAAGARDVGAEPLQWTADAVVTRLRAAGLAPVIGGPTAKSAAGMPGLRISVANGAGEVQAFVLGDPDAVAIAMRSLNPAALSTGGRTATILTDSNLGAVVLASDEKVRERIRYALIARRGEGR